MVSACANELSAGMNQRDSLALNEKTRKAAALKCANIQFKHRYESFISDPSLKSTEADEHFFEYSNWHQTAREYVQNNSHCYNERRPF